MICDRNDNGICKSPWCYHKSAGGTCLNPRFKFNPTNADRIRSMSDEELAKEMLFFVPSDFKKHYTGLSGGYFATADEAIQASLDWLRQPAKEEHRETD